MKLFRYRRPSLNTILGITAVKRKIRRQLGISQIEAFTKPSRVKQKVKYELGLYSPAARVIRQTMRGNIPTPLGLFGRTPPRSRSRGGQGRGAGGAEMFLVLLMLAGASVAVTWLATYWWIVVSAVVLIAGGLIVLAKRRAAAKQAALDAFQSDAVAQAAEIRLAVGADFPKFVESVEAVTEAGSVSMALLQRRVGVSAATSREMVELLEKCGIVTGQTDGHRRQVALTGERLAIVTAALRGAMTAEQSLPPPLNAEV